jgi:hypothetical protein
MGKKLLKFFLYSFSPYLIFLSNWCSILNNQMADHIDLLETKCRYVPLKTVKILFRYLFSFKNNQWSKIGSYFPDTLYMAILSLW